MVIDFPTSFKSELDFLKQLQKRGARDKFIPVYQRNVSEHWEDTENILNSLLSHGYIDIYPAQLTLKSVVEMKLTFLGEQKIKKSFYVQFMSITMLMLTAIAAIGTVIGLIKQYETTNDRSKSNYRNEQIERLLSKRKH